MEAVVYLLHQLLLSKQGPYLHLTLKTETSYFYMFGYPMRRLSIISYFFCLLFPLREG